MLRRLLTALAIAALPLVASAADVTVNWTLPTQNVDGSAIPASGAGAIVRSILAYGTCTTAGAFDTELGKIVVNAPAATGTVTGLAAATKYCFVVRVTNSYEVTSVNSNAVALSTAAPTPKPPTIVTVNQVAMSVRADWDRLAFLPSQPVGTIALGQPCDDQRPIGDGYYAVDRAKVAWTGSNRPANVVAKCAQL